MPDEAVCVRHCTYMHSLMQVCASVLPKKSQVLDK